MLTKLKVLAFSDPTLRAEVGSWSVQINPETFTHQMRTGFIVQSGIDSGGSVTNFKTQEPQDLDLEIHLDATGAIPGIHNVTEEIGRFKDLAYKFNGEAHSPNYLKVLWGDFVFACQLTSLAVEYLMFNPAGTPLRARLKLSLRQHQTPEEVTRKAGKKSADLTRTRIVTAATALPLMAFEAYRDVGLTVALARANDLDDLMHLAEGAAIVFPPAER